MGSEELAEFLIQQCRKKKLSFRSLSLKAGLSAGTVHNIVTQKSRPTISSLNAIADYLGVKREYLWYLAGLVENSESGGSYNFSDPQVRFHFAQVDKLPRSKRKLILSVIEAMIINLQSDEAKEKP